MLECRTTVSKGNDPNERCRRSLRLQAHDYAERGAYFVTICTKNRACLLGDITNGEMRLNDFGRLAKAAWEEIPLHFPDIELDTFVAMPNHIHGVIVIARPNPRATRGACFRYWIVVDGRQVHHVKVAEDRS